MCWTGDFKPKFCDENIPIFKIAFVDTNTSLISSYYRDFEYQFNKLYGVNIEYYYDYINSRYGVNRAFHSYDSNKVEIIYLNFDKIEISCKGRELDYFFIKGYPSISKVKGYIPKGSEYCINDYGEIVSNQIILTDYESFCTDS